MDGKIVITGDSELLFPSVETTMEDTPGTPTSLTGSAQSIDMAGALGPTAAGTADQLRGHVFVGLQARGGDVYIRLSSTATTGTTTGDASNGVKLLDGQIYYTWIGSRRRYLDVIGTSGKYIYWWKSSPNYENRKQGGIGGL